jgi:Uma2 family endonuclease
LETKDRTDQRIILHNVSWETYGRLLEERGEERVPRFVYDRGELEIVSPSAEHERVGYYVGLIVAMFAREGRLASTASALPPSGGRISRADSSRTRPSIPETTSWFAARADLAWR